MAAATGADTGPADAAGSTPTDVRTMLCAACVQAVADLAGVELLHIKGHARAHLAGTAVRTGIDVDVLVRPAHVARLERALAQHGWTRLISFAEGSAFEHAANYYHPNWGHADLHRLWPGADAPADVVFERLWQDRVDIEIAHYPCRAPGLVGHSLVLLTHVARGHREDSNDFDLATFWTGRDDAHRAAVRALAHELDAEVALAAGIGELDNHRGDPRHDLWQLYSTRRDGDRVAMLRARLRAARGLRAKATVITRVLHVNRYLLTVELGRTATRADVVREQWARVRAFVRRASSAGLHR